MAVYLNNDPHIGFVSRHPSPGDNLCLRSVIKNAGCGIQVNLKKLLINGKRRHVARHGVIFLCLKSFFFLLFHINLSHF
jgi:hypothetical protein